MRRRAAFGGLRVWPRFRSGWWKQGGDGVGWGGCGLLLASLSVQDSDGDKSDDLVVDVSNEVRAGLDCKAALGLGV